MLLKDIPAWCIVSLTNLLAEWNICERAVPIWSTVPQLSILHVSLQEAGFQWKRTKEEEDGWRLWNLWQVAGACWPCSSCYDSRIFLALLVSGKWYYILCSDKLKLEPYFRECFNCVIFHFWGKFSGVHLVCRRSAFQSRNCGKIISLKVSKSTPRCCRMRCCKTNKSPFLHYLTTCHTGQLC